MRKTILICQSNILVEEGLFETKLFRDNFIFYHLGVFKYKIRKHLSEDIDYRFLFLKNKNESIKDIEVPTFSEVYSTNELNKEDLNIIIDVTNSMDIKNILILQEFLLNYYDKNYDNINSLFFDEISNFGHGKVKDKKISSVSFSDVEENMKDILCETRYEFDKPVTYVTVKMKNGFTLRENTTCVDERLYDEKIGKEICLKKIEDKIWFLLGYKLQDDLYLERTV